MKTEAGIDRLQQLMLIWIAIFSSVAIYGAIAFLAVPASENRSTERMYDLVANPTSFALAIVALTLFFASYFIPGLLIRGTGAASRTTVTAPHAPRSISDQVFMALIVRLALLEAPAILGLVGAFIMGESRYYLPFGLLSALGLVLTFPTEALARSFADANRR